MGTDAQGQGESPRASAIGLIEKATDLQWTLRFVVAVLFLDLVLLRLMGHGIAEWSASTEQLLKNSGSLLAGFAVFAVGFSIFLPVLAEVLRSFVVNVVTDLPGFRSLWITSNRERYTGYVSPDVVRKEAFLRSDAFLFSRWQEHHQAETRWNSMQHQVGELVVAVGILAIIDWAANRFGLTGRSLLMTLETAGGWRGRFALIAAAFAGLTVLGWAWLSVRYQRGMYCPSLAPDPMQEE